MLYVCIAILTVLVLFLLIRLILIKKEMRRITEEMKENEDRRTMNVNFVDADLQKLVQEVNGLYETVMKVQAEGRDNEDAIRESISMISHDMRTPLTSVIGYLQIAERSEEREEMLANIEIALDRAQYLNKLVNDFFELSVVENGKFDLQIEQVNLCEIICEEILAQNVEIDRKGLLPKFEQADQNIFVQADRKKLVRILQNLISNAVKHSKQRLDFEILPAENGMITLRIVTDPGEKLDTERIFDRFVMSDRSRAGGGAGLGLYICRRFAEKMEGEIRAEQNEDCFAVLLSLPV
ncbi:MAG: HAMP domain-containing histidine kinase [Lachnospiraceae bacterium]|nr:HAMP domain-containing histidine kinase [Lachnospiraceae bacterium]